jgi:hypothetical protein
LLSGLHGGNVNIRTYAKSGRFLSKEVKKWSHAPRKKATAAPKRKQKNGNMQSDFQQHEQGAINPK